MLLFVCLAITWLPTMENGPLALVPPLAHFFSNMVSQLVMKVFTQIQTPQEIPEFGNDGVVFLSALSDTLVLLCDFSHTEADIMKGVGLMVGYGNQLVCGAFGVLRKT